MNYNHGELKESQIVFELNDNKFKNLSPNLQQLVHFIFPKCKDEDIVHAKQIEGTMKPDFSVTISNETHFVSMKSGINNIVHQEYIKNYIVLLRNYGFSDYVLKTILYFQYGDGTLDGSGKERMSYATLRAKLEKAFKKSNRELNMNRKAIIELVDRFLFKGSHAEYIPADYLYHGDIDHGVIISRTQVLKYLEHRDWDFYEALHIGPILFRPHARYYKKKINRPSYRARVEFYWPNLSENMDYIKTHYLP
ncbi:MAG: hypothetical protein J5880_03950 [Bacilli bacterium]|nr:hypothetical protein [Bacilli bacterium]